MRKEAPKHELIWLNNTFEISEIFLEHTGRGLRAPVDRLGVFHVVVGRSISSSLLHLKYVSFHLKFGYGWNRKLNMLLITVL